VTQHYNLPKTLKAGVTMKTALFIVLSALTFQGVASDKYVCTSGDVERTIEVLYTTADSKVPCDVKYTKPESTQILWSAQNQEGYCETKAKAFSEKLTGYGWSCLEEEAVMEMESTDKEMDMLEVKSDEMNKDETQPALEMMDK